MLHHLIGDMHEWLNKSSLSYVLSSEITGKGTGLVGSAGTEDLVELDSRLVSEET